MVVTAAEALRQLPPEVILERVLKPEVYRRRLLPFFKQVWGILNPTKKLVCGWYVPAICDHLEAVTEGYIRKLLINCPPRLGKSSIVSVAWPVWWWLRNPSMQFLCVSGIDKVVLRDAQAMRDLVAHEWYQRNFLPRWVFSKDQDAKGYFTNTTRGHRISVTTRQQVTGTGGGCIIIDDPHNAEYVLRDSVLLERDIQYFDNVLSTRKDDEDSSIVVIMQRLHQHDYAGHIIAEKTGWVHLNLRNEYDKPRKTVIFVGGIEKMLFEDPRKEKGELLCEERISPARIIELKEDLGEVGYEAQYNQDPAPPGGVIFQLSTFRYWTPATLPPLDYLWASLDSTFTKSSNSDFCCLQLWGARGPDCYLLAQVHRKMEFAECLEAIRQMVVYAEATYKKPLRFIVVEEKANGPKIISAMQKELRGVIGYNPQGETKEGRARAIQPMFIAAQIYLPDPDCFPWVRVELIPELKYFPRWRRDDQVDALTQALLTVQQHSGGFFVKSLANV